MKERNISGALFPMSLSASILLAGSLYCKEERCRKLKADCLRLRIQNKYLKKRDSELDRQQRQLRTIRHEMTNEYLLEMGYLEKGLYGKLEEHYREKTGYFGTGSRLVDTGNIGMDAVLNSKLEEADREGIRIELEHQIDGQIRVDDGDLSTLIGNLMNNAMEAVRQMESKERRIDLQIRSDETVFFMEISNPYTGVRRKTGKDHYQTQKPDRQFHGMGLLQVKRTAHKYGGKVMICDQNNCFHVKALLYMNGDAY